MSGQPNPLRRKEWQGEARREQQKDERIRELEEKLRYIRNASTYLTPKALGDEADKVLNSPDPRA